MFRIPALVVLVTLTFGLVGCPPTPISLALIHFSQLGACVHAQTGNGDITVPASHAVVIFRVSTIDNTQIGTNWSFDSTTLQVNPPSQTQQNLGGAGPVLVAANTNVPVNALVGIIVETNSADGSDASGTNYFLLYPLVAPAPGTLAVKDNPHQTSYPFARDCSSIASG